MIINLRLHKRMIVRGTRQNLLTSGFVLPVRANDLSRRSLTLFCSRLHPRYTGLRPRCLAQSIAEASVLA